MLLEFDRPRLQQGNDTIRGWPVPATEVVKSGFMGWMYDNRVLIEPRRRQKETPLPSKALMIIVPEDLEEFVSMLSGCRQSRNLFLSWLYHIDGNDKICVVGPLLGSPQAGMVLEKLIALGVREVIVLGWCGSLQNYVAIGDVVIPAGAYSEEGTSRHYLSSNLCELEVCFVPAANQPVSMEFILDAFKSRGVKLHSGNVWTTDAPYRETISKVLFYQNINVLGVDMETSALMSVARFRGISLGVILMVSDSLATLKWKPGMKSPEFLKTRNAVFEVLKDFVQIDGEKYGRP